MLAFALNYSRRKRGWGIDKTSLAKCGYSLELGYENREVHYVISYAFLSV